MKVRTRYAPSPTGYCHIGGLRTALFNYLFAKHHNGNFILRIEDTDQDRNISDSIKLHYNSLLWVGIIPDESLFNPGIFGPYLQSEKLARYQQLITQLIATDKAYYCFCTPKELQLQKEAALLSGQTPHYSRHCRYLNAEEIKIKLASNTLAVVRLKLDLSQEFYSWTDLICGQITVPTSAMTDLIIQRGNKMPTYNFAVVIDDFDMDITHVFRGVEHINNTPIQLAIYQALNWSKQIPKFGHLSNIVDESGKKISKRNLHLLQFADQFKIKGYLPAALCNFLMLLGWSPSDNKEILDIAAAITDFNIKKISAAPAYFDLQKLNWVNQKYIQSLSEKDYLVWIQSFLTLDWKWLINCQKKILITVKNTITHGTEINKIIFDTFGLNIDINTLSSEYNELIEQSLICCSNALILLQKITTLTTENITGLITQLQQNTNFKKPIILKSLRLALIYQISGYNLATLMELFGLELVIARITIWLNYHNEAK